MRTRSKRERKRGTALTRMMGPGSVFATLSVDNATDSLRMKLCTTSSSGNEEEIYSATRHLRETNTHKYPGAEAVSFATTVDSFIHSAMGWDSVNQRSRVGGGVFGTVKAFHGCVEEQGASHGHLLLW